MANIIEDPDFVLLGKRLKEIREKAGISQNALAKEFGVHQTFISRLEQGHYKNAVMLIFLHKFIQRFDVPWEELFTPPKKAERKK